MAIGINHGFKSILYRIDHNFPVNFQTLLITLLALYISYTAFVKPSVFGGLKMIKNRAEKGSNNRLKKYIKTRLYRTPLLRIIRKG